MIDGFGLVGRIEWNGDHLHMRRRGNILGKILLIITYHTNDFIKFDWIAAVQPDIHKVREYRRNFIHD